MKFVNKMNIKRLEELAERLDRVLVHDSGTDGPIVREAVAALKAAAQEIENPGSCKAQSLTFSVTIDLPFGEEANEDSSREYASEIAIGIDNQLEENAVNSRVICTHINEKKVSEI